ncbi:MAG: hypothetical protein M1832_005652 [Thelocarpon impressellum]|nr:MAG: hypothetical protein M1832_005652 [Thelocarpon impressellum]
MSKKSKSLSMSLSSFASKDNGPQSPVSPRSPRSPTYQQSSTREMLSMTASARPHASPEPSSSRPPPPPAGQWPKETAKTSASSSLPTLDTSSDPGQDQAESRPFFQNYSASKSSSRLKPMDGTIRQVSEGDLTQSGAKEERTLYNIRRTSGSTPDLYKGGANESTEFSGDYDDGSEVSVISRRPVGAPPRGGKPVQPRVAGRKNKPKPFAHLLSRSRSIRQDPGSPHPRTSNQSRFAESEAPSRNGTEDSSGLKTAPIQHDRERSFRDMMSSGIRHRSADRHTNADSEDGSIASLKEGQRQPTSFASSFKDGTGAVLLSNLKSSSTKAADGLGKAGKAGKGIFGKLTRSGSSGDNVTDDNYRCSVINLPLVAQTRRTRISKRLEHSKDKTEFWMPALPWRCIDYLNDKGCEEEGLYRIPGSGPRVKHWQRRFDTELDINLFDEPDLYDINIIGSMFKAWLRELPDEILPKDTQARIADKCLGATEVPQMLKDELSKLPPFNYYLLFAITCHLSLLHSYVDKNKMDYRNLCICFQPCLKIDGFCFQFLVCDWKHCWQGCWTEKEALMEEYRVLDGMIPSSAGGIMETSQEVIEERAPSSSSSSKAPSTRRRSSDRHGEKPRPPPLNVGSNGGYAPSPSLETPRGTSSGPGKGEEQTGTQPQQPPPLSPLEKEPERSWLPPIASTGGEF